MTYTCSDCYRRFDRDYGKGRRPTRCPSCREKIKNKWRERQSKEK